MSPRKKGSQSCYCKKHRQYHLDEHNRVIDRIIFQIQQRQRITEALRKGVENSERKWLVKRAIT